MSSYRDFIRKKNRKAKPYGFEPGELNSNLKDWQSKIVEWAVRRGRAAIFADTGLGKTLMELSWAEQIVLKENKPVLILCPLGVRNQTEREALKFGIRVDVKVIDSQDGVINGINITNYDKLHNFDTDEFVGVVLGESSILKSMTGKTRTELIRRFGSHRYRLAETATPSPNDHMELGNHAEFLSVMQSVDMLNKYFYHDSGNTSQWLLMPHGEKHFWDWVASWGVCIGMPSDIGGSDDGYILPELKVIRHFVELDEVETPEGMLFAMAASSATSIFEEKRITARPRTSKAVDLVPGTKPCVVWCDTNNESELLKESLPDAVEIRGSDKTEWKEEMLDAFSCGEFNTLISKPSICGHGLNWQHADTMIFSGLTYSFEQYYQAVRRLWRFGQTRPVSVHVILAETDTALDQTISRKESDFLAMRAGMAEAMRSSTMAQFCGDKYKSKYQPENIMEIPTWLQTQ